MTPRNVTYAASHKIMIIRFQREIFYFYYLNKVSKRSVHIFRLKPAGCHKTTK